MAERPHFGTIEITGKGKLKITTRGVSVNISESAAPRVRDERKIPEGSISSLRPILRNVIAPDTENDAGYWLGIDSAASMSAEEAAAKLKRAGFGHREVAGIIVRGDSLVSQNVALGHLTESEILSKIAEVAETLHPFFVSHRRIQR